ncbi:MAG: acetyl-CoA hydrolase [Desulfobacteraceae bacterium]|nr:acetyl-CoA hydrolase [Desulfobacteraceae bacterium]
MSEIYKRIRKQSLHGKVMPANQTIPFFKNGMYLGLSGFSTANPKVIPMAMADHVEKNDLQGEMQFTVYSGASMGRDIEDRWAGLQMIEGRAPWLASNVGRKQINAGHTRMSDVHLSKFAQDLRNGFHPLNKAGKIDLAVIEASAITEDGGIVLTSDVGMSLEFVKMAEKIIIEINTAIPSFEGLHDIFVTEDVPYTVPIQITEVDDRIGTPFVPCDCEKIIAIVESKELGFGKAQPPPGENEIAIAANILDFFKFEVKNNRLPKNLLPLQSGVGAIANAVFGGLTTGPFTHLKIWTEVMQDTTLDLMDAGKLDFVSGTSFTLSDNGKKRFYKNFEKYTDKLVLRSTYLSNHSELIRRFKVIAMNTPIEFDIYAKANSSLIGGSSMVGGIGGAGEFLRNAYLSILHSPSTRPTRTDPTGISCVLPMVTHVDQTEHDMDVFVTEQGVADVRGLCPKDRANVIINKCTHPDYQPILQDYFDRASREGLAKGAGHEPHMLFKVFNMQKNLAEKGTMKIDSWD